MTFSIGENVGAYRIVEQLGQGGMATVYKAYHAALDRYVAIKVLHTAFKEDPTFLARFQREARVVARLEHPNIVPVYDYAEHGGSPYLVMKFIEGETLKARLVRAPMPLAEIRQVVEAVGAGLNYAHRQGILHRDIKPSNVMLAQEGNIYIADFGLARIAMAGESTISMDTMLGTPHYMSPEQAKGIKELDAGTDLYSFGVVIYELMVGQVPYSADTPFAIIHDHIFTPLPLPHVVNPQVTEPVERFLLKALAKERADRYPDVLALVKAFREATAAELSKTDTLAVPLAAGEMTVVEPASQPTVLAPASQPTVLEPARKPPVVAPPGKPAGAVAPPAPKAKAPRRPFPALGVVGIALVLLCLVTVLAGFVFVPRWLQRVRGTATAVAALTQLAGQQTPVAVASPRPATPRPTETASGPIKVGLAFSNFETERWKNEEQLMRKLLEEKGYAVLSQQANNDAQVQNDQVNNMVAQGVQAIIIVATDSGMAVPAVDQAAAAGVKVIAYDRLIPSDKIAAYVSFSNVEVGRQQADGILRALDIGSGKWTQTNPVRLVELGGSSTDNNAFLFRKGQDDMLQPYVDKGLITVVAAQWVDNWDRSNALKIMDSILTEQKNQVDAVVASNDGTALGALEALRAHKLAGVVPISGQDATAEGCNSLVKGELTVTILKDIRQLAPLAVELTDKLLKGQTDPNLKPYPIAELTDDPSKLGTVMAFFLPVQQVTKDNVYDLVVKSGFQPYDLVYQDIPDWKRPPTLEPQPAGDAGALLQVADESFAAGAVEKAFALLDEATQAQPQNVKVWVKAGEITLKQGPPFAQRALEYYLKARELEAAQPDDYENVVVAHAALAMYALADKPEAEKIFQDLIQFYQPTRTPRLALARWRIFMQPDNLDPVLGDLKELLDQAPDYWLAYLVRGDLFLQQGQLKEAELDYLTVSEKGIGSAPTWVLAEARCKAKLLTRPLRAKLELTCEPLSLLVTGK